MPSARRPNDKPSGITLPSCYLGLVGHRIRTWDATGKVTRPVGLGSRVVWVIAEFKTCLAAGTPDRAACEQIMCTRESR